MIVSNRRGGSTTRHHPAPPGPHTTHQHPRSKGHCCWTREPEVQCSYHPPLPALAFYNCVFSGPVWWCSSRLVQIPQRKQRAFRATAVKTHTCYVDYETSPETPILAEFMIINIKYLHVLNKGGSMEQWGDDRRTEGEVFQSFIYEGRQHHCLLNVRHHRVRRTSAA